MGDRPSRLKPPWPKRVPDVTQDTDVPRAAGDPTRGDEQTPAPEVDADTTSNPEPVGLSHKKDLHKGKRLSLKARIVSLVGVPLSLAILVAGFALMITINDTLYVNNVAVTDADLHMSTNMVLSALQDERRDSMVYIGSKGRTPGAAELNQRQQETDKQAAAFNGMVTDKVLGEVDPSDARWMQTLQQRLMNLGAIRQRVESRSISRAEADRQYTSLTDACIGVFANMTTDKNPNFGDYHQSLVAFQRAHEALSEEDATLSGALAVGRLTSSEYDAFVELVGAQRGLFTTASADINDPAVGTAYDKVTGTDAYKTLRSYEDRIVQRGRGQQTLPITLDEWNSARTSVFNDLGKMEHTDYDALVSHAKPVVIGIWVKLGVTVFAAVAILVISLVLAFKVGGNLIRRLADLKDTLLFLATKQIPQVMERLRRGETVDLAKEAPPVDMGRDEIGQAGEAFNLAQTAAIRSAIQESEQNKDVREVFVNLSRRSQGLVQRQLSMLDEAERSTSDPAELERLFKIDHLAVRQRRHAEDLLIIAGEPPGRRWRRPVAMVDVVRGALGEVESYERVVTLPVQDAELAGRVVADVIHLLAELVENATRFSPPHAQVHIGGEWVTNGFAIEIEDRGLGLTDEDRIKYNSRLSEPDSQFKLVDTKQLGLFVVGRLAQRNKIKVSLAESPYGGTTAVVLIPRELLTAPNGQDATVPARSTVPAARPATGQLAAEAIGMRVAGPVDRPVAGTEPRPAPADHWGAADTAHMAPVPPAHQPMTPRGSQHDGPDDGGWPARQS